MAMCDPLMTSTTGEFFAIADPTPTTGNINMSGNLTVDGTITATGGYAMNVLENPDGFRDFIIWMCGVTDATDAPNEEAWKKVRNRVKEVAAEYVLARRDIEQERVMAQQRQMELDLQMQQMARQYQNTTTTTAAYGNTTSLTGAGISGSSNLTAANAIFELTNT